MRNLLLCGLVCAALPISALAQTTPGKNLLLPLSDRRAFIGWQFSLFDPAQGQANTEGSAFKFHVAQVNGKTWYAQLKYPAHVVTGQSYELKFRARSDVSVTLTDSSEHFPTNYTTEHQLLKVTPQWKVFTFRFVAQEAVDTLDVLPTYFCGQQPSTVWIDNASLTTLPSGSSLTLPITDNSAWLFSQWGRDANGGDHLGYGQPASMSTDGAAAKIVVTGNPGEWTSWQSYVPLRENITYTLRFRAKADQPRDMLVHGEMDNMRTPWSGLHFMANLTGEWQSYLTTFTIKPGMTGVHQVPEFVVSGLPTTIWLSDVSLVEGNAPPPTAGTTPLPTIPADSGPKPRPGEIKLTGTVMEIHAATKSLLIAVTAVTQPDGTTTALPAPRPKTIQLGPQTLIVTADLTQKTLGDLKEGDAVTVIGKDAGVGKTLNPRTILLP